MHVGSTVCVMKEPHVLQDRARNADFTIPISISPGKANVTEDQAVTGAEAAHSTSKSVELAAANEEQHATLMMQHVISVPRCSLVLASHRGRGPLNLTT